MSKVQTPVVNEMQATVVSRVYGLIIAYPGITAREINTTFAEGDDPVPTTRAVNAAITSLRRRNAVVALPGDSPRKTRYYKGNAPVHLNQPAGTRQAAITKEADTYKVTKIRETFRKYLTRVANMFAA